MENKGVELTVFVNPRGAANSALSWNMDITLPKQERSDISLLRTRVLADKDVNTARRMVQEAAPDVFTSNADNARFPYRTSTPNNNPVSTSLNPTLTGRQDFIGAEPFINKLNEVNDPRRPFFFTTVDGRYIGGKYGFANTYVNFSTASPKVVALDFESLLLDYAEVELLLALCG